MLRVWVIVALVALTRVAAADGKATALKLFGEADKAYKQGQFEHAAKLLREAYELFPEPILLYNLARALEGMGETEQAIVNYERYLGAADKIEDRGAIERRLATLKEQLAARERKPEPPPEPAPPPPSPVVVTPAPPAEAMMPPPPKHVAPYIVITAGVMTAGASAFFAVRSSAEHDAAVAAPIQLDAQQHQDRAKTYATIANVGFVAGGALVIGGTIWVIAGHRQRSPVAVTASPHGLGVAWVVW